MMQRRYRQTKAGRAAEIWVELGTLRYKAELYENGEFIQRQAGFRSRSDEAELFLSGTDFSAIVRIQPDGDVRCTWSR